ncbi:5-methyltetrahydropteroyltriglutamate--homocysteine S-methyltransferase [Radiobacillus kanasensis]|uniref:5-methyltetrahydropteroyltriglutamate-- homocysteine S-methyltransferase n=1 Tax=Radiobacillus kanasensis TaxID=2844358 RepID=UPI001E51AE1F|nr:5-methyltetrahydropteroyltriglutamate--homocysteine S-methyltransferase [Radiobacillus kanasensis]UFT99959.1 5-methyltetrahydropteroyltriglutamate--homocysteine S-methyltransferase [Radiobacillus kanasensis]
MTTIISSNLGYPRIGEKRQWKYALEQYWNQTISQEEFIRQTDQIRLDNLKKQKYIGIDLIPTGDFSFYDHVLDTSVMFGIVPKRFPYQGGKVDLDTYFSIARGTKDAVASEITKWFNTNYHYIVPELQDASLTLTSNRPLELFKEAKEQFGIHTKPVLLGPITFLQLAKGYKESDFGKLLEALTPLYIQILQELQEEGATWVQIDEPIFATNLSDEVLHDAHLAYEKIREAAPGIQLLLQTYFGKVTNYKEVVSLPVKAIGLDFILGDAFSQIKAYGFPKDKVLAAGIINGRNVWRTDLNKSLQLLEEIKQAIESETIIIQPSSSLLHVPVTKRLETELDPIIQGGLSFADEKLVEIVTLAKGLEYGKEAIQQDLENNTQSLIQFNQSAFKRNEQVQKDVEELTKDSADRGLSFVDRIALQKRRLKLPVLPTTTIGSLPQTKELKETRTRYRKGEISVTDYEHFIQQLIKKWIKIQEDLELDVLVHGEFERTDMVEYFGEKLEGFVVTKFGWVQSYGSRCVKPPLVVGDVSFDQPMTVKETVYAQSLTDKPVKGMLTGPTTILNWSFVPDDIPRVTILNQVALALKKEVELLEENGIKIIQIDEPALREGLPLDRNTWQNYLESAVYAFRLTTSSVQPDTQIHTHMCYSNFQDIFETIDQLDADVISIETSRSHGELLSTFKENTYKKDIGLGVYDIHSPRIPSSQELNHNIENALSIIPAEQFWINPDCGLKTRKTNETISALKVMVQAAKELRQSLLLQPK